VNDGVDNQCVAEERGFGLVDEITGKSGFFTAGNKSKYQWPAQAGATRYQVARATKADFTQGCTALPLTTQTFVTDTAVPPPGVVYSYLVRSKLPNVGSWGANSEGVERTVPCAP